MAKQNDPTASRRRIGPLWAAIDGVAVTGENFSGAGELEISINDADYKAAGGTITEIGDGYYYYTATQAEVRERGFVTVKLASVCDEFTFREDVEPFPQGIPLASTAEQDLHVGPLLAKTGSTAVTGKDFSGDGEIEVSINGAAWVAASGRVVEMSDGYYDYIPDRTEVATVGWLAVKISGVCDEFTFRTDIVDRPGVTVGVTTAAQIRDRISALITAITPTVLVSDKFRAYRNEGAADFREWAQENAAACLRRFQIREVDDDEPPDVSNGDVERVRVRFEIRIAYPQTHRYGRDNAMDRDDVINEDWRLINAALGIYGRANFAGTYDCTPLGAVKTRETGGGVDFLVLTAEYEYVRSV